MGDQKNMVAPGQTWKWKTPAGTWREMFIQRIVQTPRGRRAHGINPRSRRQLQVFVPILEYGKRDAVMVAEVPGYVHQTRRGPGRAR